MRARFNSTDRLHRSAFQILHFHATAKTFHDEQWHKTRDSICGSLVLLTGSCAFWRQSVNASHYVNAFWTSLGAAANPSRCAPAASARLRRGDSLGHRHLLRKKDRTEKMKWTNEIWQKFQNFLPSPAFFWQFLSKSRAISSFSENIREILRKFHQNFTEKWPKFIDQNRNEMKFHFIPPKKFDDF